MYPPNQHTPSITISLHKHHANTINNSELNKDSTRTKTTNYSTHVTISPTSTHTNLPSPEISYPLTYIYESTPPSNSLSAPPQT